MIVESQVDLSVVDSTDNPFPGLRSFDTKEAHLFYGREGQSDALLIKLSKTHFLAVVGTSGTGKSSLVRAGLLPALRGGMMGKMKSGSGWRIAIMRPGNDPIGNLARSLNEPGALELEGEETRYIQTQVTLRRASLGLVEAVREARLKGHENLLVVVDQFEELFRFARITEDESYANDAALFVKLLLEARHQDNIYVVLTMRSDYLGDCARFWDLPEAINEGQYLIPRMTREERREAIIGPLGVRGATITPGLVNQLLNDMGDSPDQLPVLQHALMRSWEKWREEGNESEPLDLRHYERSGGMANTLSKHADEAYEELDEAGRALAEKLFKCLTEKGADDRETRHPTELKEICLITGTRKKEVIDVIDVFRREGRSFLMPPKSVQLKSNSSIDISHESLIGKWQRLKTWVDEEAYSTRIYCRLAENAVLWHDRGYLHDPWLQEALDWRDRDRPNRAWACRHHARLNALLKSSENSEEAQPPPPEPQPTTKSRLKTHKKLKKAQDKKIFNLAMTFLNESKRKRDKESEEKERQRKKNLRLARRFVVVLATASLIISGLAWYAWVKKGEAVAQSRTISLLNYRTTMNLAQRAYADKKFGEANQLLGTFPIPEQEDLRGFDWYYLWRELHNERRTLNGHKGKVTSVAISPDSQIIATGSEDQTIRLWSAITREQPKILEGHQAAVLSVVFASDGKRLATGSADLTVKLWDTSTGKEIQTLKFSEPIRSVAFDKNGNKLAIGSEDGIVRVWDTNTPQDMLMQMQSKHSGYVSSVAFSSDGRTIASGSADGTVKFWNVDTGQEIEPSSTPPTPQAGYQTRRFSKAIIAIAFSPDGKTIAAGTQEGLIKLWDTNSRTERSALSESVSSIGHENPPVLSLTFINDKTLISGNADATLKLWDMDTGKAFMLLKGHAKEISSVAVSADGKTIVTGSADNTAKLWDVNTQNGTSRLRGHSGQVLCVAFSPRKGDTLIASGSDDGTIRVWDSSAQRELRILHGEANSKVLSVTFSPDGQLVASGGTDRTVKLLNVATGGLMTMTGHTGQVTSVAFSPDGKLLATGSTDRTAKLWDTSTGKEIKTLNGHSHTVWSVAFSLDGKTLATGSADKTIKLWNLGTKEEVTTLTGHSKDVLSVAFSPDKKLLASGSADHKAKLWDIKTGNVLATLSEQTDAVLSVAFSPDGTRLVTASYDGSVKFWDTIFSPQETEKRQELITLKNTYGRIRSMAIGSYGMMIATGREDGNIDLWLAATPEQVAAQRQ